MLVGLQRVFESKVAITLIQIEVRFHRNILFEYAYQIFIFRCLLHFVRVRSAACLPAFTIGLVQTSEKGVDCSVSTNGTARCFVHSCFQNYILITTMTNNS